MFAFKTTMAAAAALAGALALPAIATAQDIGYRPLTVAPHRAPAPGYVYGAPRPAYDPWHGPAAIVTGPVHAAGALATAPFRAINTVFPARGDTPLVLVGAPTYLAGRLVAFPFRVAEGVFGGPDPFRD